MWYAKFRLYCGGQAIVDLHIMRSTAQIIGHPHTKRFRDVKLIYFTKYCTVLKQTLSKVLEKSAKTINVTRYVSLHAANYPRPISTVAVEWPLRNPPIDSNKSLLVSINSTICFSTIFDKAGRIEMGRNSCSNDGESFLGIGLILANFQVDGN